MSNYETTRRCVKHLFHGESVNHVAFFVYIRHNAVYECMSELEARETYSPFPRLI